MPEIGAYTPGWSRTFEPERDKDRDRDEADEDAGPDVQLTTFTDWKQIAKWYARLQGERMTVDDSVRKKRLTSSPGERKHRRKRRAGSTISSRAMCVT